MAQQQINNGESAALVRQKINENFGELYLNKANTNHSSASTSYGVGDTSNYGHVKVTNGNGLSISNGTISMGSASTTNAGTVVLDSNANTANDTKAATAGAVFRLSQTMVSVYSGQSAPSSNLGKIGDIYVKIG